MGAGLKLLKKVNVDEVDYKGEYGTPGDEGLTVEEIAEDFPTMVYLEPFEDQWRIKNHCMTAIMIKAIQELHKRVKDLDGGD